SLAPIGDSVQSGGVLEAVFAWARPCDRRLCGWSTDRLGASHARMLTHSAICDLRFVICDSERKSTENSSQLRAGSWELKATPRPSFPFVRLPRRAGGGPWQSPPESRRAGVPMRLQTRARDRP